MPHVLSVDMKDYFGTIDPDIAYRDPRKSILQKERKRVKMEE